MVNAKGVDFEVRHPSSVLSVVHFGVSRAVQYEIRPNPPYRRIDGFEIAYVEVLASQSDKFPLSALAFHEIRTQHSPGSDNENFRKFSHVFRRGFALNIRRASDVSCPFRRGGVP